MRFTNGDTSLCPHHQLLTQNFWQGTIWLGIECVSPLHQHLLKMTEKNKPIEKNKLSGGGDSQPGTHRSTFCL